MESCTWRCSRRGCSRDSVDRFAYVIGDLDGVVDADLLWPKTARFPNHDFARINMSLMRLLALSDICNYCS